MNLKGLSTWQKPPELKDIDFTDPVPNIEQANENMKANQALNSVSSLNELTSNSVNEEIDEGIATHCQFQYKAKLM